MNATALLNLFSESDLRCRLDELAGERRAIMVLLRAVRSQSLERGNAASACQIQISDKDVPPDAMDHV